MKIAINSRSNREFTEAEKTEISLREYLELKIDVQESVVIYRHALAPPEDLSVFVFAVGDEYIVHQNTCWSIYVTTSLADAMDTAAEIVYTS